MRHQAAGAPFVSALAIGIVAEHEDLLSYTMRATCLRYTLFPQKLLVKS